MGPDTKPTTPVDGLRVLADWFDARDAPGASTEVQDDLRRWAGEVETLQLKVHLIEAILDGLLMDSVEEKKPPRSDGEVIEEIATILAYSSVEAYIRESFRRTYERLVLGDPESPGPVGIMPERCTVASRLRDAKYRLLIAFDRPRWWVRYNLWPRQTCGHCCDTFWTLTPWRFFFCDHPNCQVIADFMSLGEDSDD